MIPVTAAPGLTSSKTGDNIALSPFHAIALIRGAGDDFIENSFKRGFFHAKSA
jgi:hypothetical protein